MKEPAARAIGTTDLPLHYFNWLYSQVILLRQRSSPQSYTVVCGIMHEIPFKALVPHDDNRLAEGADWRLTFLERMDRKEDSLDRSEMLFPDASVFEVLVALAHRAHFMSEASPRYWFNHFLHNLGLDQYTDPYCAARKTSPRRQIERRVKKFNDRKYEPNGSGGLFPLKRPATDQRRIELWYQMSAYMAENRMY